MNGPHGPEALCIGMTSTWDSRGISRKILFHVKLEGNRSRDWIKEFTKVKLREIIQKLGGRIGSVIGILKNQPE